jgi:hypothetical protein
MFFTHNRPLVLAASDFKIKIQGIAWRACLRHDTGVDATARARRAISLPHASAETRGGQRRIEEAAFILERIDQRWPAEKVSEPQG